MKLKTGLFYILAASILNIQGVRGQIIAYPVKWESRSGLSINEQGKRLAHTGGVAQAVGCSVIDPQEDGSIFVIIEDYIENADYRVGLFNPNTNRYANTSTAYAISAKGSDIACFAPGKEAYVKRNSAFVPGGKGNLYEIRKTGGNIEYYANSEKIYTVPLTANDVRLQPVLFFEENTAPTAVNLSILTSKSCDTEPVKINASVSNPARADVADGNINISVSGGLPPYNYSWNTGNTSKNLIAVAPGTYTLTITDARGEKVTGIFPLTPKNTNVFDIEWANNGQDGLSLMADAIQCLKPEGGFLIGYNKMESGEYGTVQFSVHADKKQGEYIIGIWNPDFTEITPGNIYGINASGAATTCLKKPVLNGTEFNNENTPVSPEDKFKIEVRDRYVYFYKNEVILDSAKIKSKSPFYPVIYYKSADAASSIQVRLKSSVECNNPEAIIGIATKNPVKGTSNGSIKTRVWLDGEQPELLWSNGAKGNILSNVEAGTYSLSAQGGKTSGPIKKTITLTEAEPYPVIWKEIPFLLKKDGFSYTKNPKSPEDNLIAANAINGNENGFVLLKLSRKPDPGVDFTFGLTTQKQGYSDANQSPSGYRIRVTTDALLLEKNSTVKPISFSGIQLTEQSTIRINKTGSKVYFNIDEQIVDSTIISRSETSFAPCLTLKSCGANEKAQIELFTSSQPDQIIPIVDVSDNYNFPAGSVKVTLQGGTPPYRYSWNNSAQTEQITGLEPGTYTLSYSDEDGRTGTIRSAVRKLNKIDWAPSMGNSEVVNSFRFVSKEAGENAIPSQNAFERNSGVLFHAKLQEDITDPADEVLIGIRDTAAGFRKRNGFFGFKLKADGFNILEETADRKSISRPSLKGSVYEIVQDKDSVYYYQNNALVFGSALPKEVEKLRLEINPMTTKPSGINIEALTNLSLQGNTPSTPYTEVRKFMDNRYTQYNMVGNTVPTSTTIYYKFYEDYAPEGDPVEVRIYDKTRTVMNPSSITVPSVVLGVNWKTLVVTGLSNGQTYTLELKANKGNYYYIRFRAIDPGSIGR